MEPGRIRSVEPRDLPALDAALASLSRDLGDPHRARLAELDRAIFGTPTACWARIADGEDGIAGLVLFAPLFSTVRGGSGVYVSDLWVRGAARGAGLGATLLASAVDTAALLWGAIFLRLSVHDDNRRARAFYARLGFAPSYGETTMVLTGQSFEEVRRTT